MNMSTADHMLVPSTLTSHGFMITFLSPPHQAGGMSLRPINVICVLQTSIISQTYQTSC